MIAALREWLTAVAAVSLLLSVVQFLIPKGPLRETASFIGGLILLTALLRPVLELDLSGLQLDLTAYQETVEQRRSEMETAQKEELAGLIEAETAAYISDKAAAMGLALQVRVTAEPDAEGVPVPSRAELTGPRSEKLALWLETELGLPAERQVWHED